MNKNYLIIFIIVFAIITYNCLGTTENMAVIQGKVYLKGDIVNKVFDLKPKKIINNPVVENNIKNIIINEEKIISNKAVSEEVVSEEVVSEEVVSEEVSPKKKIAQEILDEKIKKLNNENYIIKRKRIGRLWEGKDYPVEKIIDVIQSGLKVCDVNDIYLKKEDVSKFDSRKKFIALIPMIKKKFRSTIDYNKIKCYVSKFEPDNYININEVQKNVPKIIPHKNSIIINNFLYYYSPFGVLKYKIDPKLEIDSDNGVINASFESTMINNINKYNSSNHRIVPYQGKLYQIKSGQFHNLVTDKIMDINKIVNKQVKSETIEKINEEISHSTDKYFKRIVYLLNYSGKLFIVKPKQVIPNIDIGYEINKTIKKNNIIIKGVIPHFFYQKEKFNVRFLFLCSSNFFFYISDDTVSGLLDFKKIYGYNFGKELDYKLSCKENTVILDQLVKANKIPNSRKEKILKRLKC